MVRQIDPFVFNKTDTLYPDKLIVVTSDAFNKMLNFFKHSPLVTFDFETSGLDWFAHAQACGLALGGIDTDSNHELFFYIPFRHLTGERQLDIRLIGSDIKKLLEDPAKLKIAHNLKFDMHIAAKEGWQVRGQTFDTMLAAHLENENRFINLKYRAKADLHRHDADMWEKIVNAEVKQLAKVRKIGIKEYKSLFGYSEVGIYNCGTYACFDVDFTYHLWRLYTRRNIPTNYSRIWKTESKLVHVIHRMEQNGMFVNIPYLSNLRTDLQTKKDIYTQEIYQLVGKEFNIGSDDDIRDVVQNRYHIQLTKLTKKNKISVDKEALEAFAGVNPAIERILAWREVEKLLNTYTTSILKRLDSKSKIHPDYQQVGTNSGRLSCKMPNFQNQPTDSDKRARLYSGKSLEDGGIDPWSIRRAFTIHEKGIVRLYYDYCLHPYTPVETIDGVKPLYQIKVGDKVATERQGQICCGEVTKSQYINKLPSFKITFSNGESVIASDEHKWPIQNNKHIRETMDLIVGTVMLSRDSKKVITVVNSEYVGLQDMYAITVEPDHNYVLGCGVVTMNSQIELRILTYYTQDPVLMNAYLNNEDIHKRTSLEVFNTQEKAKRRLAKCLNFGTSYCMGPEGFAALAKISIEEATKYYNTFLERYAGIPNFRFRFWNEVAAKRGYFTNKFGRPRRLPDIISKNKYKRTKAQRQAIATLIQGTAAELTKESMVRVDDRIQAESLCAKLVATVHDEIQVDCPIEEVARVGTLMKEEMEDFPEFAPVPIIVDGEYTLTSWADKQSI